MEERPTMVAIAFFCFVLSGLGLLGFNVWYYRALTDARSEADAYWTLAQSWQKTATLAVDAMERLRPREVAASHPDGGDILDRIFAME
jgi:hypothetical protein